MQALKAICGYIKSALQWYIMFTGTLKGLGYELNQYDTCVVNKMIDDKQYTIAWHVDDAIASHVDQKIQDNYGAKIIENYDKMKIASGN